MAEQPLHTDGAHRRRTPDIVLLHSEKPSSTATRLLRPTHKDLAFSRAGVFLVDAGTDRFLATALDGGLRWDPVCMTPMDARARRVAGHFASLQSEAEDFTWHADDTLLVLDNRRMLHGRAEVSDGETDRVLTRVGLQRND